MPKRHTGRGPVRRLLFAASLALIVLAPAWATPPAAAAADRLPNLRAAKPSDFRIVNSNERRLLRFTSILVNVGAGPMEVLARRPSSSSPWTVRQVIDNDAGGERRGQDHRRVWHEAVLPDQQRHPRADGRLPAAGGRYANP